MCVSHASSCPAVLCSSCPAVSQFGYNSILSFPEVDIYTGYSSADCTVFSMPPVREAVQQHLEIMPGELQQRVSRIRALVETLDEDILIHQEDDTIEALKRSGSMILAAGCHLSMRMRELRNGEWDNLKWYCWLLASVVAFGSFFWSFVLPVLGGVPLA